MAECMSADSQLRILWLVGLAFPYTYIDNVTVELRQWRLY